MYEKGSYTPLVDFYNDHYKYTEMMRELLTEKQFNYYLEQDADFSLSKLKQRVLAKWVAVYNQSENKN